MRTQSEPSSARTATIEFEPIRLEDNGRLHVSTRQDTTDSFIAIKDFIEERALTDAGKALGLVAAQALDPLMRFGKFTKDDKFLPDREDVIWTQYFEAVNAVIESPVRRLRLIPPGRTEVETAFREERHWGILPDEPLTENRAVHELLERHIGSRFRESLDDLGPMTGIRAWNSIVPFAAMLFGKSIIGDVRGFENYARFVSQCATMIPLGRTQFRLIVIAG